MEINRITPNDTQFTARLSAIALKPKKLYYYGVMPSMDERFSETEARYAFEGRGRPRTVAVVGARKCTDYGREQGYKIAYELARQGVVVVSGLAFGIDSVAHRAALDAGGMTVAVLGTPIDQIYPACHKGLAEEIVQKKGAVISEYPEWQEVLKDEKLAKALQSQSGRKAAFLQRNRLISGLSDIVVVVEADLRSGSLNTAHHAFEQSNLVYAVPGDVTREGSRGCNKLLGRGAVAFTETEEILLDLGFKVKKAVTQKKGILKGDSEAETQILERIQEGRSDGEEILEAIQKNGVMMTVSDFTMAIFDLQIKGRIKALGGNRWMLID